METYFIITLGTLVVIATILIYVFRGIFKSSKKKIKFYHESKLLGKTSYEQSD